MAKERVSSDIDRKLRIELDAKATVLGISRAKLIEIALKNTLEHFNVHKENKRLTAERNRFKAQAEEAETNFNVCSTKVTLLLTRRLVGTPLERLTLGESTIMGYARSSYYPNT